MNNMNALQRRRIKIARLRCDIMEMEAEGEELAIWPSDADWIIGIEEDGRMVDLLTGAIIPAIAESQV